MDEELRSTQLLALLHCVGLGLGLPGAHLELLHPLCIEVVQKTSQSSGLAPNPSHWEVQWHCSLMAPEGKFGRKSTFQSNERDVLSIILFTTVWVYF